MKKMIIKILKKQEIEMFAVLFCTTGVDSYVP